MDITELLLDAVLDTVKILPFLFIAYIVIEFIEHRAGDKINNGLKKLNYWGPLGGAFLGLLPQCGFSVAAANFFSGGLISLGTLIAVFIATSDELIPIMLSQPESLHLLWPILGFKFLIAVISGFTVDLIYRKFLKKEEHQHIHQMCDHCGCEDGGILKPAISHTVKVSIFILAVNLILGFGMEFLGEEQISQLLLKGSVLQPMLAALIGLIPNCASSVILTELYISGSLSFGSVIAGLSCGAGIGLAVLFNSNKKHLKQNLYILGILYFVAVFVGLLIDII